MGGQHYTESLGDLRRNYEEAVLRISQGLKTLRGIRDRFEAGLKRYPGLRHTLHFYSTKPDVSTVSPSDRSISEMVSGAIPNDNSRLHLLQNAGVWMLGRFWSVDQHVIDDQEQEGVEHFEMLGKLAHGYVQAIREFKVPQLVHISTKKALPACQYELPCSKWLGFMYEWSLHSPEPLLAANIELTPSVQRLLEISPRTIKADATRSSRFWSVGAVRDFLSLKLPDATVNQADLEIQLTLERDVFSSSVSAIDLLCNLAELRLREPSIFAAESSLDSCDPSESPTDSSDTPSDPITMEQAAYLVGKGLKTLQNRKDKPPHVRVGGRGKKIYRYRDIRPWLASLYPDWAHLIPEKFEDAKKRFPSA